MLAEPANTFLPLEQKIETHVDDQGPSIWKTFPRAMIAEAQPYELEIVSVGPLYAQKSTLMAMVDVKKEYFLALQNRL